MDKTDKFKSLLHKLIKEELESSEEEKPQGFEKINYDLVLEPADLQSALSALSDIKNYGIYANNLRDPKIITKIFGPSIPAQKANTAWRTWDGMNEDEKFAKATDIRNRVPEAWKQLESDLAGKFDEWQTENGEGSFIEFVSTLNSTELRNVKSNAFFGSRGVNYYPMKTPDNLKKYSGVMTKDKDYVVSGDKIIFPQKTNPFETKDYLTKVLKTIMGNAKLKYNLAQKEADDQPTTTSNAQGAIEKINFVKTFDSPELAKKFMRLIPKDFAPKTSIDNTKVSVLDITDLQKKNLMAAALKFISDNTKKPVKENKKSNPKIDNLLSIMKKTKAGPEYKKALSQLIDMAREKSGKPIFSKKDALLALDYIEPSIKESIHALIQEVLAESMSDKEWKDAKEADRLEKHPEKDKIKKIQALLQKKLAEKKFPDLTGDGKVTRADILKGRGVELKNEGKNKTVQEYYDEILDKIKLAARSLNDDDAYELHEKLKTFFNKLI
jgi:hypothetical protein